MVSLLDVTLFLISVTALATALYAIRRSDKRSEKTEQNLEGHMKALDVLAEPDYSNTPRSGRHLRLMTSSMGVTPAMIEWAREKIKRHPGSAASVITAFSAAAYIALIWPSGHPGDAPLALQLPDHPPITTTESLSVPATSAASTPSPVAVSIASEPTRQPSPSARSTATLGSQPVSPAAPRSTSPPANPTTPPSNVPCALRVQTVQSFGLVQSPCLVK